MKRFLKSIAVAIWWGALIGSFAATLAIPSVWAGLVFIVVLAFGIHYWC